MKKRMRTCRRLCPARRRPRMQGSCQALQGRLQVQSQPEAAARLPASRTPGPGGTAADGAGGGLRSTAPAAAAGRRPGGSQASAAAGAVVAAAPTLSSLATARVAPSKSTSCRVSLPSYLSCTGKPSLVISGMAFGVDPYCPACGNPHESYIL